MLSKILFVDDDPLMHQLYRPHVERAGYGWIGASGGRGALKVAAAGNSPVAGIEPHLPAVGGLSTVAELKRAEATKAMPIIVISSEPEYYVRKRDFTDAGAAVFLTKPFGPGQLLEAIGRLLPSKLHVPSEGNGFIRIGH